MAAAAQYRVKGTHIAQVRLWVESHCGEGSFAEIAKTLPDTHGAWPGPILPGTWYDALPLTDLLRVLATKTGLAVEAISTEICSRNAKADLVSVYRAFLKLAGPHLTLAATPKLWANYVAFAGARAVVNEPGNYVGEGYDLPQVFVPWACGAWMGFIPTAIEVSGGKNCVGRIVTRKRQEQNDLWMVQFACKYQ